MYGIWNYLANQGTQRNKRDTKMQVSGTGIAQAPYHRGATSNQRAARETAKISSAQSKNAREYWQQSTLSSEDGQLAKTANGIPPD